MARIIEVTEEIKSAARQVRRWGAPNPHGVSAVGGDTFTYYLELNRRGQFKNADGKIVVFEPAEVQAVLEYASGDEP